MCLSISHPGQLFSASNKEDNKKGQKKKKRGKKKRKKKKKMRKERERLKSRKKNGSDATGPFKKASFNRFTPRVKP